jgi:hypothetical protein
VPTGKAAKQNFSQNTIDLQWKMRANYNARPCAGEGKAAGAETMASNEKTMRRAIGTVGKSGEC